MVRMISSNSKKNALISAIKSAPIGAKTIRFGKQLSPTAWLVEYNPAMDGHSIYQLTKELGLPIIQEPVVPKPVAKPIMANELVQANYRHEKYILRKYTTKGYAISVVG